MNCSSVYIFKDKEDRQNIEMYQKLADLVFRIEGEIYPDNLAVSKRADNFWETYDDTILTKKERRQSYEAACQRMEEYIQKLKEAKADTSYIEALRGSDMSTEKVEKNWSEFLMYLVLYLDIRVSETFGLKEAYFSYCTTYKEKCFKIEKGDIFMWVSGKYHLMNIDTLMEAAETPEETELVSKVMIGYSRHFKEGYWFDSI